MKGSNQTERFAINPDAVYTFVDNETVIMSSIDDKMFGLNEIATDLLKQMESNSSSIEELTQYIINNYDVDEEQCRADLDSFIEFLVANQLVKLK